MLRLFFLPVLYAFSLTGCGGSGTNGGETYSALVSYFDTTLVDEKNLAVGQQSTNIKN